MRSKTADILYSFCISCGGLAIALLYSVDAFTMLFILTLSITLSLFCCLIGDRTVSKQWVKKLFGLGSLLSASVSVYSGTELVCSFALDKSFIAICIFLACSVALCLAVSSLRACKSVSAVTAIGCILFLIIIFVLCLFECDFEKVISTPVDRKLLFPLSVFCTIDSLFIMPYIRKTNKCMFVVGSALMPAYMLLTVLLSISTLSPKVYSSLNTPIITLWQSCYVASFIDRFETVVLCAIYAVCAVKAGMLLKCVFDIYSKRFFPIAFIIFSAAVVPLVFMPSLLYVYALLSFLSVLIYTINVLLIK